MKVEYIKLLPRERVEVRLNGDSADSGKKGLIIAVREEKKITPDTIVRVKIGRKVVVRRICGCEKPREISKKLDELING